MKVSIKDIVFDILLEEKEDKSKSSTSTPEPKSKPRKKRIGIEASTGSGRFSAGVKEAGALAKEDPKKLMQNLKVKSAVGQTDIEKIKTLLVQAFIGTDVMKNVYSGLSQVSSGSKTGLKIKVAEIKVRDGIKYLYHTLIGAQNAGILKLTSLIQIENASNTVIIYSGERKTWEI